MHLEACRDVTVRWGKYVRAFAAGERIHAESSVKYDLSSLQTMFADAGFKDLYTWTDTSGDFAVCHAGVARQAGRQNARQASVIMDQFPPEACRGG